MAHTVMCPIEGIVVASSNVDGIGETIFTQGIGKVPERFRMARGNVVQAVNGAVVPLSRRFLQPPDGPALHLSVQPELMGDDTVAYEDELSEEAAVVGLHEVFHFLTARNANDRAT